MAKLLFHRTWLWLFLATVASGPLSSALFLYFRGQEVVERQSEFALLAKRMQKARARKARKEAFLQNYTQVDPYFLDREVESLSFLTKEQALLSQWLLHPAVANKEKIGKRLKSLGLAENRLRFTEEERRSSPLCKETLEKQRSKVELDGDDLARLLSLIENNPPTQQNRPHLLIKELSLTKKKTQLNTEVFEMKMDLLKREFQ